MTYTVVLPLPRYCGSEAATCCSRSLPPLSLFYQDPSPHANRLPPRPQERKPSSRSQTNSPSVQCVHRFERTQLDRRGRTVKVVVQTRDGVLNPRRRPRLKTAETLVSQRSSPQASFSTSATEDAPSTLGSHPVALVTSCQSPRDLLRSWHRTIRTSAATRRQQPHTCITQARDTVLEGHDSFNESVQKWTPEFKPPQKEPSAPTFTPSKDAEPSTDSSYLDKPANDINALMRHPAIFENIKAPRNPIVLCHGLYGFDVRGPFLGLEIHYWAAALEILRNKIGAQVIVRGVPGTGSIASRAKALHEFLCSHEADVKGAKLNFVGHSMGGLDARYLISHIKPRPEEYIPVSVTSISTPHRGSPFMDWCNANVGIGNEYVEEAIREYEQNKGEAVEERSSIDREGPEKLPYSLKNPLFVRPKKNGNSETEKAKDEAISRKAVEEFDEAKKESSGQRSKESSASSTGQTGIQQQVADALESAVDKLTPDNQNINLSSSSTFKSLTSLGFVSPLTRALSSFGGFFSSYMLSVFDQPAYAMLSTRYMAKVFNPSTPDSPDVSYFSIAARIPKMPLWHPLWLPKVILDAAAESRTAGAERDGSADALGKPDHQGNDGLVSITSAQWGQFLGVVEKKDHWDLRGSGAPRWGVSGKVNPATGKPFKDSAAATRQAALEQKVEQQRKETNKDPQKSKGDDGWLMINRILGRLLGSRSSSDDGKQPMKETNQNLEHTVKARNDGDGPPSLATDAKKSAKAFLDNYAALTTLDEGHKGPSPSKGKASSGTGKDNNESGLVNEVASWISDRLPQGSEERRKLADEAIRQQQSDANLQSAIPIWADGPVSDADDSAASAVTLATQPTWNTPLLNSEVSPTSAGSSSSHEIKAMTPQDWLPSASKDQRQMLRLRREADWLESTGQKDSARELRREIEWHRDEHYRGRDEEVSAVKRKRVDIGPGPDAMKSKKACEVGKGGSDGSGGEKGGQSDEEKRKKKERNEKEELERFWIALCQHLYSHGY